MSFSSLPPAQPVPQVVLRALNLFINRPVPQVLESKWELLLTDLADQILTERIKLIDASGGPPGKTVELKFYRWFLRRARQQEIAVACQELSYLTDLNYRQFFIDLFEILFDYDTWCERRHALEQHLDLLDPELDGPLKIYAVLIEQNSEMIGALGGKTAATDRREVKRIGNDLHLLLETLREAREHGGTAENIRQACVNFFGGLALDAPPWFVEQEKRYFDLLHQELSEDEQGDQEQTGDERKAILDDLIKRSRGDTQVAPETLAELRLQLITEIFDANLYTHEQAVYEEILQLQQEVLQIYTRQRYPYRFALAQKRMGDAYLRFAGEGRRKNLEAAIRCYTNTIEIATKELSPLLWAETQIDLAHAYRERMAGSRPKNMELSKEACEGALQIFTRQDFPDEWASAQHALANAYFFRMEGEKADNIERAIMHYYLALQEVKRNKNPRSWGMGHYSLGNCYTERIEGSRKDNLEQAITHFKMAEQALTDKRFRQDWAMVQGGLGLAYLNRTEGILRDNIEQAISYFKSALKVFTKDAVPKEWTVVQQNLGSAYWRRLEGARNENLEQAIHHFEEAERVCPRKEDPYQWAMLQYSLGNAYSDRQEGNRWKNLPRAIRCYKAASQVWKRATYQREWALARHHLGSAYNQMKDEERAITCYKEVLQYYTRENHPYDWSGLQRNLALAYLDRTIGNTRKNIHRAITHLKAALEVQTREEYPIEWAGTQEILGRMYLRRPDKERQENVRDTLTCYEAALQVYTENEFLRGQRSVLLRLGNVEAEQTHWEAAHTYFAQAASAENTLSQFSAGAMGRDLIRGETADASTRDAYALVRLRNYADAAVALEQGQARDLAEGLRLNTDHPEEITDPKKRERYQKAKEEMRAAQRSVNASPALLLPNEQQPRYEAKQRGQNLQAANNYREAQQHFQAVFEDIPEEERKKVLQEDTVDADTIREAAGRISPQHALIYLVATPWGGFALAAQDTGKSTEPNAGFFVVDLPHLTTHLLAGLLDTRLRDGTNALVGGYAYAQQYQSFALLDSWLQQGKTFREAAALLHKQCAACQQEGTLDYAAQEVLTIPELASHVDIPLDEIDEEKRGTIVYKFERVFLHYELQRCFEALRTSALSPLLTALREHAIASLTLIPCGWLATFSLTTVLLEDGRTVGGALPTSTAPSARSLWQEVKAHNTRSGVYALGDSLKDLKWAEAEAHTVARLAWLLNLGSGRAIVQDEVTHKRLVEALNNGLVVDVSCHGAFDNKDFRRSCLLLAKGRHLYLGELLSHEVDLRGLRLLILSACQTAVLDLNGAVNEVRSLASGVLQSGAQSVLASLWPVNEYATYLLIVYFARQWLPNRKDTSPAEALAEAQHWLRNVTWGELQEEIQQWNTIPATVRSARHEHAEALKIVHADAKKKAPGLRPFESPVYWAGFQVTGW